MNNSLTNTKISQPQDYPFIKFPRELFYSDKYASLSSDAKCLYIAMLERQSLSQKNNWADEEGNIYIILTHHDAVKYLNCSRTKLSRVFAELDEKTGVGLIKRKRQGLGKPDIIYLNSIVISKDSDTASDSHKDTKHQVVQYENFSMYNKKTTGCSNSEQPDVLKTDTNYINNNKNNINKNNINNPSFHFSPYEWIEERNEYTKIIKENIDYETLIDNHRKSIIDDIVKTMVNAVCTKKDFIRISCEEVPAAEVKKRFLTMNSLHINYVYDRLMKNKSSVRNAGAFLLTCLYRASDNMDVFYQLKANHDVMSMTLSI